MVVPVSKELTLAKLLIVLPVVGIVAAFAIPHLIRTYPKIKQTLGIQLERLL